MRVHTRWRAALRSARAQVLVNALVSLMDRPPPSGRGGIMLGAAAANAASSSPRTATLDFVTSLVTARRVTVQPPFVLLLLQHVLAPPPGSGVLRLPAAQVAAAAGGGGAGGISARASLSSVAGGGAERRGGAGAAGAWEGGDVQPSGPAEQLAICILDVVGVNAVHAARQAPDKLSPQVRGRALWGASVSGSLASAAFPPLAATGQRALRGLRAFKSYAAFFS